EYAAPLAIERAYGTGARILLAGDDTALPAIGTILEHLPRGTAASVFAEVAGADDELDLPRPEGAEVHWVHRGPRARPGSGTALLDAVRAADLGGGPLFAWLAGEAGTVRALRRHLVGDRGVDKRSIDFTGYWRQRLTQDDAPTEEDMAEAQERLALADPGGPAEPAPSPSPARAAFDDAYSSAAAPWETGRPQPAVVELEKEGRSRGTVLDVGCGTGENALHLAERGHDVVGVDFSPVALERARAGAAARGARVRFEQADALDLPADRAYDTVLDSALFHVFSAEERSRYTASLHRACRPGGRGPGVRPAGRGGGDAGGVRCGLGAGAPGAHRLRGGHRPGGGLRAPGYASRLDRHRPPGLIPRRGRIRRRSGRRAARARASTPWAPDRRRGRGCPSGDQDRVGRTPAAPAPRGGAAPARW